MWLYQYISMYLGRSICHTKIGLGLFVCLDSGSLSQHCFSRVRTGRLVEPVLSRE